MAKAKYGRDHQAERRRLQPDVDAGRAICQAPICLEPTRQIAAGAEWHLGHNEAGTEWQGPWHPRCNTTEGAIRGRAKQLGRDVDPEPVPYSRDW